jgi:membrane protein YdbS with pleckstrin-like domain
MRSSPTNKLSKSAIRAWRISLTIASFIVVLVPAVLWMINFFVEDSFTFANWTILAGLVVIIIASGLAIFFIPEIRWQHWFYQVDEHEIDLQSGIFIITRTLVPIKRVQHVDTRRGPILRSYGLADVTISTAATTHRIPALDEETADRVRNQISKFARLAEEDV